MLLKYNSNTLLSVILILLGVRDEEGGAGEKLICLPELIVLFRNWLVNKLLILKLAGVLITFRLCKYIPANSHVVGVSLTPAG